MESTLISKQEQDWIKFSLRKWCVEQGNRYSEDANEVYAWVVAGGFTEIEDRKWAISEAIKEHPSLTGKYAVECAQLIYAWVNTDNPAYPILWPNGQLY